MSGNNIETKLSKTRRAQPAAPEYIVKNVTVTKNESLSLRGLITWLKNILEIDDLVFDDTRTGAIYCQLLHALFPKAILLAKVRLATSVTTEFEANFRILRAAFNKLGVLKDIPSAQLMKGPGNYEFCNWFHSFFLANSNGKPYPAKELRHNLPIGLPRGDTKRSQSVPRFHAPRILEDKLNNSRYRRNSTLSRISPRTRPIEPKIDAVDFWNESKSIDLPPDSSSEENTPRVVVSRESKTPVAIKLNVIPIEQPIGVPEAASAGPEPGLVVPEPGLIVPEPGLIVPELGLIVPEPGLIVPELGLIVPEPGLIVPEPGLVVPEPAPTGQELAVPESGQIVPEPGQIVPEPGQIVPEAAPVDPEDLLVDAEAAPIGPPLVVEKYNRREKEIKRFRREYLDINFKLTAIRNVLLGHFDNPTLCVRLIRQIIAQNLPMDDENQQRN